MWRAETRAEHVFTPFLLVRMSRFAFWTCCASYGRVLRLVARVLPSTMRKTALPMSIPLSSRS